MKPGKLFSRKEKRDKEAGVYDVIVIGSGSGMLALENAVEEGLSAALVDMGPAGGTCLNLGCIPSKMLIAAADRVMEIREAERFGISADISRIDFKKIMADMKKAVVPEHQQIHQNFRNETRFDYYEGLARFTGDRSIEVNGKTIRGKTFFIASGSRPKIPEIPGLKNTDYLTSDTLLDLEELPASLAVIGGGYIAAEYAHFFSAMGSRVTILQSRGRLVPAEEPEISRALEDAMAGRIKIKTGATVSRVENGGDGVEITFSSNDSGKQETITTERLLVAAGRMSNADRLAVEKTGMETDQRGFIKVDEYLETSKKGIWAFGDANGAAMFTHVANAEASTAWSNAMGGEKEKFDYSAAPRAIFTWPPIASVGLKEQEARKSREILVGTARYDQCAMGEALREDRGFAKIILDRQNLEILGFHIIGPHAPMVIQEVVNAMAAGGRPGLLLSGMHIHPALNELVLKTFSALQ